MTPMIDLPAVLLGDDQDAIVDFAYESEHAVTVDWREEDAAIIDLVAEALEGDTPLTYEEDDDGEAMSFELSYGERRERVKLTMSPKDRYITLRGIARVLEGAHELRLFQATYFSDTHVFYVRPVAWWAEAERLHGAAIARTFRRIDDTLDFP